jgi:hypothetical protein
MGSCTVLVLALAARAYAQAVCIDDCHAPNGNNMNANGVCNDGGEGAEYSGWVNCELGHDCTDCGNRTMSPPP